MSHLVYPSILWYTVWLVPPSELLWGWLDDITETWCKKSHSRNYPLRLSVFSYLPTFVSNQSPITLITNTIPVTNALSLVKSFLSEISDLAWNTSKAFSPLQIPGVRIRTPDTGKNPAPALMSTCTHTCETITVIQMVNIPITYRSFFPPLAVLPLNSTCPSLSPGNNHGSAFCHYRLDCIF